MESCTLRPVVHGPSIPGFSSSSSCSTTPSFTTPSENSYSSSSRSYSSSRAPSGSDQRRSSSSVSAAAASSTSATCPALASATAPAIGGPGNQIHHRHHPSSSSSSPSPSTLSVHHRQTPSAVVSKHRPPLPTRHIHSLEDTVDDYMSLPSPQIVGREFVRQYYTLLNQSPLHLHRFYSTDSSFIHGGLSEETEAATETESGFGGSSAPVTGQKQIHEKIMSLNFRDCHAKIRQVDAHATLDSGVVVQVSGELSNNGGPMRRFMQTFVLAPQSPKKYYVHNDIFRYQDEVFSDEDHETPPTTTTSSSNTDPHLDEDSIQNNNNKGGIVNNRQVDGKENVTTVTSNNSDEQLLMNGGAVKESSSSSSTVPPSTLPDVTSPTIMNNSETTASVNQSSASFVTSTNNKEENEENNNKEASALVSSSTGGNTAAPHEEDIIESSDNSVSNGPITYAKLVKSGPSPAASLPPLQQQGYIHSSSSSSSGPSLHLNNNSSHFGSGKFNNNKGGSPNIAPSPMTMNATDREGGYVKGGGGGIVRGGIGGRGGMVGRNSLNREQAQRNYPRNAPAANATNDLNAEDERPRGSPRLNSMDHSHHRQQQSSINTTTTTSSTSSNSTSSGPFSDSQQLFVGNLPHNCSGDDLKALFAKFGKVIEIRINGRGASLTKTNPSGMRVPNYGFVVFEDENSVTECLKKKPIFLPDGNHRLNIEEKKVNKGRSSASAGGDDMRNMPIVRSSMSTGGGFERGSQDLLSGGGRGSGNISDRGTSNVRGGGSSRPGGSRGGRGGSVYQGGAPNRGGNASGQQLGGQQQQQRGGYNRRS